MTCRLRWYVEMETRCRIPIWWTFGRIQWNGMSSQSHVSHCKVLPLCEFTVTIPEPYATLQGVRIPSAIFKIVYRHILSFFLFLMLFRLWRASSFVSSPVHLLISVFSVLTLNLCRVMLCMRGLSRHAVSVRLSICVSVCHVPGFCQNKLTYLRIFFTSGSPTILVFPHQTTWQYSNGNFPNGGVECRWGRRQLRFWANFVFTAWCQRCDRPAVINTTPQDHARSHKLWHVWLVVSSGVCWWRETMTKCITRGLNVMPKM